MEEVLRGLLDIIKQQNEVILELTRLSKSPPPEPVFLDPSPIPMFKSETEEDLEAQLRAGLIDKSDFQDALKEIGFYSSEIVVPTSGTDL